MSLRYFRPVAHVVQQSERISAPRINMVSTLRHASPIFHTRTFPVRCLSNQAPQSSTEKKQDKKQKQAVAPLNFLEQEATRSTHKLIVRNLLKYLWPKNNPNAKFRVIFALSLLVASKILSIYVPFYFKDIVDAMNIDWSHVGKGGAVFTGLVLSYGLARFGSAFFGELRNAIFATVAQRAIRQVSKTAFDHLMRLDITFHLSNSTGQLTRAIDRGCKGISYVLTAAVFHLVPITLEIGLVAGVLSYKFGPSFAAVALGTMVTYAWFTIRTTAWRTQFRRNVNQADNQTSGIATETFQNIESVVLFNNQKRQLQKYDDSLKNYETASVDIAKSLSYLNSGQSFIFSSALTLMMYMTCNGIVNAGMTVGDLILVNQLVFQLSVPLNFLGTVYRDLSQAFLDMESLFTLLQQPVKIKNTQENMPQLQIKRRGGEVKFENVAFAYRENQPILRNMSFTIPAGKSVAFVGPSGSGKSTILKLLFRFYEPQEGRILVDGQDIKDVDLDSLRSVIGVVPQDTPLFNDTIMNNVRFGNLAASDEQCHEAVENASLTSLMNKLPDGYDTMVGERGLMISGGERQRLAIARVLVKGAPINFFDEATSALDTETERSLLMNIYQNFHNGTMVFIAHRLRTVANTDKIIVLNNGDVAEEGSHHELLAQSSGLYKRMWDAQEDQSTANEELKELKMD